MTIDWSPLHAELAQWRAAGLRLQIWWRDDDAIAATPALDQLTLLADALGLPVHIAVIPALAEQSIADAVADHSALVPVVHGWQHISHAPEGAKKAEFGQPREGSVAELREALARMQDHFGKRLLPMFVPPWNRIDDRFLPALAAHGYAAVSTYGPRARPHAVPGLAQINTHIDPIFWRGDRGLVAPDILIAGIITTLRDRRVGRTDAREPLGLLTHHLVHTQAIWHFTEELLRVLLDGGAMAADVRAISGGSQA